MKKLLLGTYESSIGKKHQISLPKEFREYIGNRFIITKGIERNLLIVSGRQWRTLLEGTQGQPFTNTSVREIQRYILGNVKQVELDDRGRFVIPEYLRTYAGIRNEAVFLGIERYVELWDKDAWEIHQARLEHEMIALTKKLTEKREDAR